MATNIWDLLERLFKPVLSTAMHDIYNEINNIFFLYESTLMSCKCMSEEQKREIQQDFFTIMEYTKAKQFVFNNICSEKMFTSQEFAKHVQSLREIQSFSNKPMPLALLSIIFLMNDAKSPMVIRENTIVFTPKQKFIAYLQQISSEFHNNKNTKLITTEASNSFSLLNNQEVFQEDELYNNQAICNDKYQEENFTLNLSQGNGSNLEWLPQLFLFTINKYNFDYLIRPIMAKDEKEILLTSYDGKKNSVTFGIDKL